ncbi:MAG: abortive infection family protein, partial [Candidatus Altiarchaeota archaeon]|nr:abortive infection family protein [Candidatus Altiarchaeota archaeon]
TTRTEKGIPHGKGKKDTHVDRSYADFALHLSGTFIVFLIERYGELK